MFSHITPHIKPQSKGGETNLDNLALACQGCNNHKYNKTEAYDNLTNKITSLYNPRQQNWHEHFNWNEDFTLIIGLTATGRATICISCRESLPRKYF